MTVINKGTLYFLIVLMVAGLLLLWGVLLPAGARAADPHDCHELGLKVGIIVQSATGDDDLMQRVAEATEAHCILLDEPPVKVKGVVLPGTVPASGAPLGMTRNESAEVPLTAGDMARSLPETTTVKKKTPLSAWQKTCRTYYRTFRISDGTVIPQGRKTRVRCPVKP